jgi:FAD:protein FMN transferase
VTPLPESDLAPDRNAGSAGHAGPAASDALEARADRGHRPDTSAAARQPGSGPGTSTRPKIDPDGVLAFEGRALGSVLRLFVDPGPSDAADDRGETDPPERLSARAWARVQDEMAAVDLALSRFREDSELTRLNRRAGTDAVVEVSWRMRTALAAMHRATRLTGGRFDASVLSDLERLGEHGAELAPAEGQRLDPAAESDGRARDARLERPSRVRVPAVPVDTGGIGKGLALRWAVARASEVEPGAALLVDAGGDVVAGGRGREGGWRVGIEDPGDPGGPPLAVVNVARGAIATSSVGVRNWTAPDGRRVHHLLDPRTGEPARTGLVAVTVAGPDPAWSEVWTKALFLAGRRGIGDEARARGFAAWWVDEDGRLGMTPAARLRCDWVAEERLG